MEGGRAGHEQEVIVFMDEDRRDTEHSRAATRLQNTLVLVVAQAPPLWSGQEGLLIRTSCVREGGQLPSPTTPTH